MGLFGFFGRGAKGPGNVDFAEAQELLAAGAVLLDVRENREWNAGHAPGAVHIPSGQLAAQASRRVPKGRPVVVVCASGSRSKGAARVLHSLGIEAHNLRGGMRGWERAGGPVVGKGNRPGMIA